MVSVCDGCGKSYQERTALKIHHNKCSSLKTLLEGGLKRSLEHDLQEERVHEMERQAEVQRVENARRQAEEEEQHRERELAEVSDAAIST
ncbi:hypothetical protein A0H81_14119 [Grifola frondosa]|uniref:C2H2-type domain-containing protein n=1 Tax=Grifola frondosa TaxID=5627 RepID=A0A1C7LMC5_GRIFR|nr:hypothetical protein A0H81_14119 [Grifola frondosa]